MREGNDPPRRRRRRQSLPGVVSRLPLVLAGFLVAGVMGASAYFMPLFSSTAAIAAGTSQVANQQGTQAAPTDAFTVLLLGSDDDAKFPADRVLTQSMILVRVDPVAKQVTMLSIPRDLWVNISGMRGKAKIDAAYEFGGAQAAIDTVQTDFGVHIDDYVWIGLKGLVQLIDRMGGVNIEVTNPVMDDFYPSDVNTDNPYGYYRVAALPGPVHMDGIHALQYVRSRHGDLRGDFARSERQQQLLLALKAEAKQLNATDLPDVATAFNGELKTSMGIDHVRHLLPLASQFGGSSIHQVVLLPPYTSSGYEAGQSVILPDWARILPLVHQSFP